VKHIASEKDQEVLRFDIGDDVLSGLLEFVEKNDIKAAWVWMVGASREVELGFYDVSSKEYKKQKFGEVMEILSVSGNIATLDGKPVYHLHGSFAGEDYKSYGGHVHRLIANATVEVFIHRIEKTLVREYNSKVGLNLLKSDFNMEENKHRTSPKDFFLNLLSMVALYMSAGSFIALIFQYINIFFPDVLDSGNYGDPLDVAYRVIRFAVSTLIVSFPVYLLSLRFMGKDYVVNPEKRNLRIRKWLVYFTLFVVSVIIMGDFIALINTFLGGELTVRFILKVLTVLAVTGSIFWYYLWDLRKYKTE